jgi:hypothetical protein
MASKRRSRTVEILPLRTSRRSTATNKLPKPKKSEDKKLISETTKVKNVIREIGKPKQVADEKPQETKSFSKKSKPKKIHKCEICEKIFKGEDRLQKSQNGNFKLKIVGLNDLRKHLRIHSDEVS